MRGQYVFGGGGGGVSLSAANTWLATQTVSGASGSGPDWEAAITGDTFSRIAVGINTSDVARLSMGPGNAARNLFLEWAAAANARWGAPDAAAPVAQTQSTQNVVAGTSNTAGATWTFKGSQGTGTGVGGSIIFQVAPAGSTGTAQNALASALTIDSTKLLTVPGAVAIGGATIGPNALAVTGTALFNNQVTNALGTITTSQPLTVTQTWNAGGVTFNSLLVNVTSTASAAASTLLDLQVASASKFKINKTGDIFQNGGAVSTLSTDGVYTYLQLPTTGSGGGIHLAYNSNWGDFAVYPTGSTAAEIRIASTAKFGFSSGSTTNSLDTILTRGGAAATLQYGAQDAASPVAQTTQVQSVVAGTSNTAGADWIIQGSRGTGTGVGGKIKFQSAAAGSTGTSQNAAADRLTLDGPGNVVCGNAAIATNATDGFIYIPTCAGTPSGTPTSYTGRVPMVYDTTNHKLYTYDGGWKGGTAPGAWS